MSADKKLGWQVIRRDDETQIQVNLVEKLAIVDMAPCANHDDEKLCLKCIPAWQRSLVEAAQELSK